MNVYCTIKVEDVAPFIEVYRQGDGAVVQIGSDHYPVLSVNADTKEIEIGHPITYH